MTTHHFEFEASTLDEARQKAKSALPTLVPKGPYSLKEEILSSGLPKRNRYTGATVEAAYASFAALENAYKPAHDSDGDVVVEKKTIAEPTRHEFEVLATDEAAAQEWAKAHANAKGNVAIKLVASGKKGFLGIGRSPNRYTVSVDREAIIEITHKSAARIRVSVIEEFPVPVPFAPSPTVTQRKAPPNPTESRNLTGEERQDTPVEPRSSPIKMDSSLLEFLDKSEGTDELYEMLRTRSSAEIEEVCRTFPIDSIRLSWGSISVDAKAGDMHAILSEVGSEAGLRDIKRFELITVLAQVLVRYEEILKESPHLHLPRSFPAARCAEILMSRLMPFVKTQKAGDVTQTLRVRLYDFAIELMKAGGGRGDWHDRAALDCLLVSRPSPKVDHEFWIFGCRFNIALASKSPDDVAAAAKNAELIVSGDIKVPEKYIQGAKQMLDNLKKWKVDQPRSA